MGSRFKLTIYWQSLAFFPEIIFIKEAYLATASSDLLQSCSIIWNWVIQNNAQHCTIPDICHKHHKRCWWRKNLSFGEIFPYERLSCGEVFPHVEKFVHKRNVETNLFFSQFMLFCWQISFAAIYAVLSRNLFCRDLRAFVWRKVKPKIVLVEKKRQISGMLRASVNLVFSSRQFSFW